MQDDLLSVILPVFNEEHCIRAVLEELHSALTFTNSFEIVVVDDGSTDRTPEILRDFSKVHPRVRLLSLNPNSGQSAAFWAGIQAAAGTIIALMDADGQNDPADIEKCAKALADADICCGFRANRQDTFSKRMASRLANRLRRAVLRDAIIDTGCSLKAFKAPFLKSLQYWDGMHRFLPVLASLQGATIAQIPVNHRNRIAGKSKYTNFGRLTRTLRDLFGVSWMKKRTRKFTVIYVADTSSSPK